jgi:hypothetical protein
MDQQLPPDVEAALADMEAVMEQEVGEYDPKADPMGLGTGLLDGTYQVEIMAADAGNSQKGNLQLAWGLKVLTECEKQGHEFKKYSQLASAENLKWFQRELYRLGIMPEPKLRGMIGQAQTLIGSRAEIVVKTKGEFQNVYFQKRIDL